MKHFAAKPLWKKGPLLATVPMTTALAPFLPWTDRAGRFSRPRALLLTIAVGPALWLVGRAWLDDLGPRPLTEAIHVCGDWAVRWLVATIVVTPLGRLLGNGGPAALRRMIGLTALAWAIAHVGLWMVDLDGDIGRIAREILVRPYLTLGFTALTGLIALGATSTDGAIRRLGSAWRRLHGLVHPITLMVLVHVFLQSRLDLSQGAILTGVAAGGLTVRVWGRRATARGRPGFGAAAAASAVALGTAAGAEAVFFALKTGRAPWGLLSSLADPTVRLAPAWIAAAIVAGVAGTVVTFARARARGRGAVTGG